MGSVLPEFMKAVTFDQPGPAQVLKVSDLVVPMPAAGQVLIKVAAAGVNRPDVIQRLGQYPAPKGHSPILGLEVAGEVVALGAGADPALLGQNVCALVNGGGYAQYCIAEAGICLPVPDGLSMVEAAAIPETLFTVWHNVFERGWASDGERVLVHGGTSGIGTMAITLGKAFGLEVIVTCGSDEKCERAIELGAAHAINYRSHDFVEEVKRISHGEGVHLVLDMVAGDYVARNLKCLADDGRHVTIAVQGGAKADVPMWQVMARRLTLTGSTLRARSNAFKTLLAQEIAANVWPLVDEGEVRPVMARTYPLEQAAQAHAQMESGDLVGKIVLEVV
ncbi:NAD(P)H-quinone oxidoreductase [Novosphingobium sediminicola]|uniref:Putative PIG3 family NAD(P)H quinone oxidoreductase n=1 Tax=Novosphingobium sediminicola TaxID=563162 RepID=A0A7W6G5N1_9SPHN|nr:NAD(P)H-quinone oxidoreductase [Novosphingobium sediminicola]MBB3954461.1 putative PIG3 family NAD(P)H quinone oxidoreductase [Novosphingobium sediminicola]